MFEKLQKEVPRSTKLTLVLSTLLSLLPTEVKALELAPGANWHQGANVFEEAAQNELNEFASTYVETSNGNGFWVGLDKGDSNSVHSIIPDFEEFTTEDITTLCFVHSHPETGKEGYHVFEGPSLKDLRFLNSVEEIIDNTTNVVGSVFTKDGVWYHKNDSDVHDLYPQEYPTNNAVTEQVDKIESYVLTWVESFGGNTVEHVENIFLDSGGSPNVLGSDEYINLEQKLDYLLPLIASKIRDEFRPNTHVNTELYFYEYLVGSDAVFEKLVEDLGSYRRDYATQIRQIHSNTYFNNQRLRASYYDSETNFPEYVSRMAELYALQGVRVEFVSYML